VKAGVHEKQELAEAYLERRTREFGGQSEGPVFPLEKKRICDRRRCNFKLQSIVHAHSRIFM